MDNQISSTVPEHCRSLFLGDLSCFCSEQDVYNFFRPYGEIQTIRVMRGKQNKALGYGFVTYVDLDCAVKALALDGELLLGRPVKVGWANVRSPIKQPYNPQAQKAKPQFFNETAQIHFSFISKQHDHVVTEQTIREVFEQFAEVADVSIKKSSVDPTTNEQNGYGFVHFPLTDSGILGAIRAAKSLHQVFINNVLYDCCLTWSLEAIIQQKYNLQALPGSSSAHRHGQQLQQLHVSSQKTHQHHQHHQQQHPSDRISPSQNNHSNHMAMMNNYMNRPHLVTSMGSFPMQNGSPKYSQSNSILSPLATHNSHHTNKNNNHFVGKPIYPLHAIAPFTFPTNTTTSSPSSSASSSMKYDQHHPLPHPSSCMDSSSNSSTSSQHSDFHATESHRSQQNDHRLENLLLIESMERDQHHSSSSSSSHVFSFLRQSYDQQYHHQHQHQPLPRGILDLVDHS